MLWGVIRTLWSKLALLVKKTKNYAGREAQRCDYELLYIVMYSQILRIELHDKQRLILNMYRNERVN
jgi:hypothetical protein